MGNTSIQTALLEDDPAIRQRLEAAIGHSPELTLVGSFSTLADARQWLLSHRVDVMLVDLGLPDGDGVELIAWGRRLQPSCQFMVVTMFADKARMMSAFEAGATGYLLKDGSETELAEHVQHLHAGGSPLSPLIARQLLQRWQGAESTQMSSPGASAPGHRALDTEPLTLKERNVLELVARGFTYVEVAAQTGVAVSTVRTHVRGVYAKLGAHNKTEAVFEARSLGLLR